MSRRGSAASKVERQPSESTDRRSADPLDAAMDLLNQGQWTEAAPLFQQVLRAQPNHAAALHGMGLIAHHLGMFDRAMRLLRQALEIGGPSAVLLNDLGRVLVDTGGIDKARLCFHRCIDRFPDSTLGYVSLAYLENLDGRFEAAESLYQAAIARVDQPLEAELNLATLYREWGHLEQAVERYDALLAAHPDIPLLSEGRARALLQQRKWRNGWEAYESRFLIEDEPAKINLDLPIRRWRGESLTDKHLLVLHEQGIGDEVQFASCYRDVIAAAARCTISCSPRLRTIFQRSFPEAEFVAVAPQDRETWIPEESARFDFFVPAGSLPRFYRDQDSDFSGVAYLRAQNTFADQRRPRVGLSWWGGARADEIRKRSIPLDIFRRLLDTADVQFVNMQHGRCDQQTSGELSKLKNLQTYPIDPYLELDSWFDLLGSVDLLISVDNSNVHFAGALGVPTWLLLPDHPNWRWPRGCDKAPWYNSVRLIPKSPEQGWESVISETAKQLAIFVRDRHARSVA